MSGTISKVEFRNPHVTISLDLKNPDGTMTRWNVETAGPNALIRGGITKDLLAQGAIIVIDGYPAKDGSPKANGRTLILADGREFRLGPWEFDLWNPLRVQRPNACDGVQGPCIKVEAPAK
jgi:hypothetical protein